jgi:signal transduction histidine kinase
MKDIAQPKIIVSADSVVSGRVTIKVADNGSGIKEELLDKIFIPFFSTKRTGSGIGLSLCKQVMMLHRGHIHVLSKENEGTIFTLQF